MNLDFSSISGKQIIQLHCVTVGSRLLYIQEFCNLSISYLIMHFSFHFPQSQRRLIYSNKERKKVFYMETSHGTFSNLAQIYPTRHRFQNHEDVRVESWKDFFPKQTGKLVLNYCNQSTPKFSILSNLSIIIKGDWKTSILYHNIYNLISFCIRVKSKVASFLQQSDRQNIDLNLKMPQIMLIPQPVGYCQT